MCTKAVLQERLEWYPGAGEFCPECGETLRRIAGSKTPPPSPKAPERPVAAAQTRVAAAPSTTGQTAAGAPPAASKTTKPKAESESLKTNMKPPKADAKAAKADAKPPKADAKPGAQLETTPLGLRAPSSSPPPLAPMRWLWIGLAIIVLGIAAMVIARSAAATTAGVSVCPAPSAANLAADLVRGYTAKAGVPAARFALVNAGKCDVRFTITSDTDALIARDGVVAIVNPLNPVSHLSESQIRSIFNGSIHDWSELGGSPGPIVPMLTDAGSDEAKVLASTLFYNVAIDGRVRRSGTSADVTRAVAGVNRENRGAIGLVAFSAAIPAKVVPLTYLPSPSVLSISTNHYPYIMNIGVQVAATGIGKAAATGLVAFAHSSDGAAVIAKDGFVGCGRP
jgi:hypothetical protein